jgi:heme/copper-type cytochrome/quinol oxidase subunit 3
MSMASEGAGALGPHAPEGALEPAARLPPVAEQEPPGVRRKRGSDALDIAARLLAGAATFFFLAFVFAYFYLRSLDVDHQWRPAHVDPDQALGAVFVACLILSVVLALVAGRAQERGSRSWVTLTTVSLLAGLAAVASQCVAYTVQHFGPTDGTFASVFCAWTAFYLIAILGTMYWLEIQVATELRERREPAARPGEGVTRYEHPDRLLPRGMGAAVFFWTYLGALGVVMYVILYLL